MSRRALAMVLTVGAALVGVVVPASPASADTSSVPFTAAALPTWQTNGQVYVTATAGGLVFAGGEFSTLRPPGAAAGTSEISRVNFAVLDAATGSPTSCAPAFEFPTDPTSATVRAMSVSPDGATLYIGGYFGSVDGQAAKFRNLAALDIASCTVVDNFRPLPNQTVRAVTASASTVFFGGAFSAVGTTSRTRLAAVESVTSGDPGALLPWAPTADKDVRALVQNPAGTVVVAGGDFNTLNDASSHALGVVDATTGANLRLFPAPYISTASVIKGLAADAIGFYTANEGTGGGVFDGRIAIDWDTYNERWRDTCLGATQSVVVFQGILYSASHAHDCSSVGEYPDGSRHHFLAEAVTGTAKLGWFPNTNDGTDEKIGPRSVSVSSTSQGDFLWSGGDFTSVNSQAQQGLTRFGTTDHSVAPSNPGLSIASPRAGVVRVVWRSSFDADNSSLTYRVYRDNFSTPIYTVSGSSWFWRLPQLSYVDSSVTPGSKHVYRVTSSDGYNIAKTADTSVTVASTNSAYAERVVGDGATMYLRYSDPATSYVADSAANDNMTLSGSGYTQVSPGALSGDASSGFGLSGAVATAYSESSRQAPTVYSLETWFKTTSTTGGKLIGFGNKQTGLSSSYDKQIYLTNNGQVIFGVYTGVAQTLSSASGFNNGQWHHVAATQGSAGMVLYVDGVRVGRNNVTGNQSYVGYWRIGGDNVGGWPSAPSTSYLAGSLDETAIYGTALSAQTVRDHFVLGSGHAAGGLPTDFYGATVYDGDPSFYWRLGESSGTTANDVTGSGLLGTYSSGVTLGDPSAVQGTSNTAIRLTGSSAGLVSSQKSVPGPATFSSEAWVRTAAGYTGGGQILGFGSSATTDSSTDDRVLFMRTDGRISGGVLLNTAKIQATSSAAYNDGNYHHVVLNRTSTAVVLYVDGAQVAVTNNAAAPSTFTGYWRVGGDLLTAWGSGTGKYLTGSVDEVAVYPTPQSASAIAAHFSAGRSSAPDVAAPTVVSAAQVSVSGGAATLSWAASIDNVGVTGYAIYRSTTAGFTPSSATKIATVSTTNYVDSVGPGTYYYRVVAVDAAGNTGTASNELRAVVNDISAPSAPTIISAGAASGAVSLSWSASSDNVGVSGYGVYRSTSSGFVPGPTTLVGSPTDTSFTDGPLAVRTYYYRVVALDASGNVSAASPETAVSVSDTTAPSVPGGLTTNVSGSSVNVSWLASTDDTGVTGYDVYRSATSGFTPSAATLIKTTTAGVRTVTDTGVPEGTSYYRVVAKDAAGNRSAAAAEVAAVIAPYPVVVSVQPTADTYAVKTAPGTNVGSSASLSSGGGTAISYLRFVIPSAPAGKSLTSAVLRLKVQATPASSGSVDPQSVGTASDAWDETTLTWNNRPTQGSAVYGALAGGTQPGGSYDSSLDVAGISALLGTQSTLTLSGADTSVDGVNLFSNNASPAANRPTLLLTFSPIVADTTPPSVPSNVVSSVDNATVSLSWLASSDDTGVTSYGVYRSSAASFVPSPATLVSSTSATTFAESSVPVGTWYYRVAASDAAGNASAGSAAIAVTVTPPPDTAAPSVPTAVTTSVSGSSVTVQWAASTDDRGVTGYDVFRSTTPGFSPSPDTLVTSTTTATTVTDDNVAVGTVYYRVTAHDAAGNASAGSAAAAATVSPPPDTTAPSVPSGATTSVSGSAVTVSWSASTDDTAVTSYSVYRSASASFTPSGATLVSAVAGTTLTESAVPTGTWYYRVTASDAAGNDSLGSSAVSASVTPPPDTTAPSIPAGVTAASADSTVTISWSASTDDTAVSQYDVFRSAVAGFTPSSASLVRTVGAGVLSTTETSVPNGTWFYRVRASDAAGNVSDASAEVSVVVAAAPVTVSVPVAADSYAAKTAPTTNFGTSAMLSSGGGSAVSYLRFALPAAPAGKTLTGATLRVRTYTPANSGSVDAQTVGTADDGWDESTLTWNNRPIVGTSVLGSIVAPDINSFVDARLNVASVAAMLGTSTTFTLTGPDASTDGASYYAGNTPVAANRPMLVLTFSSGAADATAPTAPTGTMGTVAASSASVSWSASTDDTAVVSYDIFRSATSGATPSPGSLVRSVTAAATSTTETSVPDGKWYYRVVAKDAAGNRSAASLETSVIVAATPVTVSVALGADTYGAKTAPSTNFGTSAMLSSGGGSAVSYLRFVLPAAPPGKVLTGATLRVRTYTPTSSGSVDTQLVGVADDSWDESTLTWNNRPSVGASALGTLSGPDINTFYDSSLNVSSLVAMLGSSRTFTLSGPDGSTDGMGLYSGNTPNASNRPVLLLTFSPAP